MWAHIQGTALNTIDQQGNVVDHRDTEWIHVVLSYLQDDTAIWAAPAMEEFVNGNVPFNGLWETFQNQFKAWFETINEAINTRKNFASCYAPSFIFVSRASLSRHVYYRPISFDLPDYSTSDFAAILIVSSYVPLCDTSLISPLCTDFPTRTFHSPLSLI